jgi:predicted CXXCH cytochrome family protein
MSRGSWLVCLASALLALTIAVRASDRESEPQLPSDTVAAKASADRQGATPAGGEYLGSASCERCHAAEHTAWKNSLHIKMTKPVAEATIVGDFREGTRFADHDRSYTFGMRDGKPYVSVSFGGRAPETFTVDYTLGAKRYQGYLATLPEGRIYVLPVFWHVATRRWVDWKEITPIPDGAHDIRQIWNANCFNCHATNIVQGFDIAEKKYKSTWTEMGIGCEACHGPGREHTTLMDQASKPAYDTGSSNRQLSDTLKILSTRSAEPRRVYDTCAYCHGNKRNVFVGFKAGDRYEDHALPFLLSDPIPDNDLQGEFWPDGRPNRFNRPQALTMSGCFKAGEITCTSCHSAHGSPNPFSLKVDLSDSRSGDALCTQCHSTPKLAWDPDSGDRRPAFTGAGLERHTFHAADSAGSRCVSCHMSDVNWRLLTRRRDHTFQPPVPENTAKFGIPNACTTCHDDRSPEWAAKQMTEWWGDGDRRTKATVLADTMYRAGSGDASALPALAKLAVDRSEGFLIRASAADYIGRLVSEGRTGGTRSGSPTQTSFDGGSTSRPANLLRPTVPGTDDRRAAAQPSSDLRRTAAEITPTIVNSLIGAAADPEPVVRASAVASLGAIGDRQRALAPILARLVDQARVVRVKAAEVLVGFGIVELPGAAGEALRKAQDEYVVSLDTFPDSASNHAAKGWLEAERGNVVVARDALNKATAVESNYAFPWVVKGVLFAREGKFTDAAEMWKKARSIEPSYPNIDQLIAEAGKRK